MTTKLAGIASAWGNRTSSIQQVKYVGNTDVFCIGFYFMSPKWTRTEIVIDITLLLQTYCCLLLVQVANRFLRIGPEVPIAISLVLIEHGKENPFHRILVCIYSTFKQLKCEAVNFSRSHLAHANVRHISVFLVHLKYLGMAGSPAHTCRMMFT